VGPIGEEVFAAQQQRLSLARQSLVAELVAE
jgi:hypothetical protein